LSRDEKEHTRVFSKQNNLDSVHVTQKTNFYCHVMRKTVTRYRKIKV